ncbi:MAG: CAP domain-containing protein [Chloroflexota bacterium]
MKNRRTQKSALMQALGLIFALSVLVSTNTQAQTGDHWIYLPLIMALEPTPEPECNLNSQEQALADFMRDDPNQQRPSLRCDPILAQVARERALDMGNRNYFSHVNLNGYGPNYLVQQAGYSLPSFYGQEPTANNIESISAGRSSVEATWTGWMNSDGHRTHILGLQPFWAEQTDYGIGYAYVPGSTYGYYWVVITARH